MKAPEEPAGLGAGLAPGIRPEVTPGLTPGVSPEVTPEAAGPQGPHRPQAAFLGPRAPRGTKPAPLPRAQRLNRRRWGAWILTLGAAGLCGAALGLGGFAAGLWTAAPARWYPAGWTPVRLAEGGYPSFVPEGWGAEAGAAVVTLRSPACEAEGAELAGARAALEARRRTESLQSRRSAADWAAREGHLERRQERLNLEWALGLRSAAEAADLAEEIRRDQAARAEAWAAEQARAADLAAQDRLLSRREALWQTRTEALVWRAPYPGVWWAPDWLNPGPESAPWPARREPGTWTAPGEVLGLWAETGAPRLWADLEAEAAARLPPGARARYRDRDAGGRLVLREARTGRVSPLSREGRVRVELVPEPAGTSPGLTASPPPSALARVWGRGVEAWIEVPPRPWF